MEIELEGKNSRKCSCWKDKSSATEVKGIRRSYGLISGAYAMVWLGHGVWLS